MGETFDKELIKKTISFSNCNILCKDVKGRDINLKKEKFISKVVSIDDRWAIGADQYAFCNGRYSQRSKKAKEHIKAN